MSYTQLALEQRYTIYALKKRGKTQTEIAETIGVHKSTVSQEIRRNTGGRGYRYKHASPSSEEKPRQIIESPKTTGKRLKS